MNNKPDVFPYFTSHFYSLNLVTYLSNERFLQLPEVLQALPENIRVKKGATLIYKTPCALFLLQLQLLSRFTIAVKPKNLVF